MTKAIEAPSKEESVAQLAALQELIKSGHASVAILCEDEGAPQDVRQMQGVLKSIDNASVTARAEHVLQADNEAMLWQESPSLSLIVWPLVKFITLTSIAFFLVGFFALGTERQFGPRLTPAEQQFLASPIPPDPSLDKSKKRSKAESDVGNEQRAARKSANEKRAALIKRDKGWQDFSWYEYARNAFVLYLLYKLVRRFAELKTTKYRMSSQRLVIDRGILSRTSVPYELHNLANAVIHQPLMLRLFGISNVYVSGILLEGLRNAEVVRDLIRNAGQLEAGRTDKIRWR